MYLGKIVEIGDADEIWKNPLHVYTSTLLSAVPIPDPDIKRKERKIIGEPPSSLNPPSGCRFHPRCPYATTICKEKEPKLKEVSHGHYVACHRQI